MQVRIRKDIFNSEQHLDRLDNLLTYFRKGKHAMLLDDIDDIDAYENSEWKKGLNSRDIKLINSYIKSGTRINKSYKIIDVSELNPMLDFAPKEADMYLGQHLVILLENSEYDPPFINMIFNHFDTDGSLNQAKVDQNWKYGMGGGSAITSVINSELNESFKDPCFTKDKKTYLRYFVILDSDKKYPTMPIEPSKHSTLDEQNVPYHILFKREKENYVPLAILGRLKSEYLNLYIKFSTHEQRDFFDLEKGFNDKPYDKLPNEIKQLYPERDVSTNPYKILRKGIDIENYQGGKIKREFSKLFNNATREEMFSMIANQPKIENLNEFEHIIREIKKIL
ncbi:hypothetical protein [Dyadobacter sp. OTU695]|uniref:hypothetical protein n=1 Tax=Dyadobacter sp. OTU695 TaxID=3043860 RepID=UPI00313EB02E